MVVFNIFLSVIVFLGIFSFSLAADVTDYQLESVEFVDNKALKGSGDLTFEIIYTFSDEKIGIIHITCDDNLAKSFLIANNIFPNEELESSDFYCFAFHSLVEDLMDVTDDYQMPSFFVGKNANKNNAYFDFSSTPVTIPIEINKDQMKIFSRNSGELLKSYP